LCGGFEKAAACDRVGGHVVDDDSG
jgi:hypothetical protein